MSQGNLTDNVSEKQMVLPLCNHLWQELENTLASV